MQAPTHFLVGILIQKLIFSQSQISPALQIFLTIIFTFLSHFAVDCFSVFTYHPPEADWKDKFWVSYHLTIYGLTLAIIIIFGADYGYGLVFSVFVDLIDWVLLRAILKKDAFFHPFINKIINVIFPNIKFIYRKWTVIFEFTIIAILWVIIKIY